MVENLSGCIHLTQDDQHLLVDEALELSQVHVQFLFQSRANDFGGDLVQVDGHHYFFEGGAYYLELEFHVMTEPDQDFS